MTHWTISRLKDFETCPAKYDYAHNQKLPGLPAPAADRGTEIHGTIERFLLGLQDGQLHREISLAWRLMIGELKRLGAVAEQMWELTEGWHPRAPDEPLWWRGKLDAHYVTAKPTALHIIDFKTGKPYPANIEQLEVYALAGFARCDVNTIHASLWYLDSDEPHDKTFTRDQAPKLARKWEGRAGKLLAATTFPHKPGRHCGWCQFRKTCPHAQTAYR